MTRSRRIVYLNGQFVSESQAKISIFDTALATGEVVVEVVRTFNHRLYNLEAHLRRLFFGLQELGISMSLSRGAWHELTQKTLERNLSTEPKHVDWQIIYYVSRGPSRVFELLPAATLQPTIIIQCIPLHRRLAKMAKLYRDGVDLVIPKQRLIPADLLSPQIKSRGRLDYILARIQAKTINSDATGVLLDADGYLTEGTGASLFLVRQGTIMTAPSDTVLHGVTRQDVFNLAKRLDIPLVEKKLLVSDAEQADEIFLTSTVICLVHARSFDGKKVGDSRCGQITGTIRSALMRNVGVDFIKQAREYARMLKKGANVS